MWLAVTAGFCSLWVVFFFFFISQTTRDFFSHRLGEQCRTGECPGKRGPCAPRGEGAALMGTAVRRRGWQLGNSCHHGPTPTMPSIIQFAEWELGCDERRMKRRIAVRRNGPGRACSIGTCLARRRQLVDGNETKHGVVGGKRRRKEGCCGLWDGLHM
ncbi:hypothetical protein IWZ01DRAFT_75497 [Phyllosticta capitalensis]